MRTGGLAHATGARQRSVEERRALDASWNGPRRRSCAPRSGRQNRWPAAVARAAPGGRGGSRARSKPSSVAVAGPRVLLAYAEHFPCAGRARGRGAATAHRRGPTRGRDRLARRTSTMEKVELLMIGREATEEASGDAEAPTKRLARAGAPAAATRRSLARASPGACLGPARRGRQGRGRGRWPRRPAARGAVAVAPGRRSQGPASSLRRRRRGAHGHGVGRGPGVARRRRVARRGVVLRHCRASRPGSPRTSAPPPWTR